MAGLTHTCYRSRINGLEVDSSYSRHHLEQVEHQTGRLALVEEDIGFVVDTLYSDVPVRPPWARFRPLRPSSSALSCRRGKR